VLANGNNSAGGVYYSSVLLGLGGVLYAVPTEGANSGRGSVLQLTPPAAGKVTWKQTVLHKFAGYPTDGLNPQGRVIADKAGSLYGTTTSGGANNQGVVFKLTRPAAGKTVWTESILYSFRTIKNDASQSRAPLVFDAKGNLYGTTIYGGGSARCVATGFGAIYKLTPPAAGKTVWTETTLYKFQPFGDCNYPSSALIIDKTGALFGTAPDGGTTQPAPGLSDGCAFTLKLSGGKWKETVIYTFTSTPTKPPRQGATPEAALIADTRGNLYGTTNVGGAFSEGTIFKLTGSGFAE
jgi:uncharacterized repeat protein (TIGR03803 family)